MAEQESQHRRDLEVKITDVGVKDAWWKRVEHRVGQCCALIFACSCVFVGGWVSASGHPVAGTLFGGGTLASVVGAFLYREREQAKDTVTSPGAPTGDLTRPTNRSLDHISRPKDLPPSAVDSPRPPIV